MTSTMIAPQPGGRQVGVAIDRRAVGAKREIERDAAVAVAEPRHHFAKQVGVGEPAMGEHDGRPAAALEISDVAGVTHGPCGQSPSSGERIEVGGNRRNRRSSDTP